MKLRKTLATVALTGALLVGGAASASAYAPVPGPAGSVPGGGGAYVTGAGSLIDPTRPWLGSLDASGNGYFNAARQINAVVPGGCSPVYTWTTPSGTVAQGVGSGVTLDTNAAGEIVASSSYTPSAPGNYSWAITCGAGSDAAHLGMTLASGSFNATPGSIGGPTHPVTDYPAMGPAGAMGNGAWVVGAGSLIDPARPWLGYLDAAGSGYFNAAREIARVIPAGCSPVFTWTTPTGTIAQAVGSGVTLGQNEAGETVAWSSFTPPAPGTYSWSITCGASSDAAHAGVTLASGSFNATPGPLLPGPGFPGFPGFPGWPWFPGAPGTPGAPSTPGGTHPVTGAAAALYAVGGGLLAATGGTLLVSNKRRKAQA